MDPNVIPDMPFLLSDAWWGWLKNNFGVSIMVFGTMIGGLVAATPGNTDNKVFAAIRRAMPWNWKK